MSDIEKYQRLYNFVKKVALGFCLNQTDEEALKMLVSYEKEAQELYDYINGCTSTNKMLISVDYQKPRKTADII